MEAHKFGLNKFILIVDDVEDITIAMRYDFEKNGFTVFTAGNGNEAINVLESQPIDVIISDIHMPECDGFCLLEKTKLMQLNNPYFLFMTGYSNYTQEKIVEMGASALVIKPVNRKEMLRLIQEALESSV